MTKDLVIVFVKNISLGKVKTRLAHTIGNQAAYDIYADLLKITENVISQLDTDTWVFFSEYIDTTGWNTSSKDVQKGVNLGERMLNAFKKAFEKGYDKVVLIGSDLSDLETTHVENGFEILNTKEAVFGPAKDGGYYLVGMQKLITEIFIDKPWSQRELLEETLKELSKLSVTFGLLEELNDIDTYEDLVRSDYFKSNIILQEKLKQLNE